MAYEVGSILEGKVTGITNFGVFVALPEGGSGMVHISEVAYTFVKEIRDFVQEGQQVKVKVLAIDASGKISLSMKRAQEEPKPVKPAPRGGFSPRMAPRRGGAPAEVDFSKRVDEELSFEDKLNKFKHESDEKMSDLKRYMDTKRGSMVKRGSGNRHG